MHLGRMNLALPTFQKKCPTFEFQEWSLAILWDVLGVFLMALKPSIRPILKIGKVGNSKEGSSTTLLEN